MRTEPAAALRVALLVAGSLLVSECWSAPAGGGGGGAAKGADLRPLWKWPCGELNPPQPGKVLLDGGPVRHAASRTMKRLRKQFQLVRTHYLQNEKTIKRLYGNISTTLGESQYIYHWLPRGQLHWYRTQKQCSSDKVVEVLPELHRSLQNFSVTFEAMRRFGDSAISDQEELLGLREALLGNISTWHKTLHCETETAIHNMRLPVPEWTSSDILSADKWPSRPDLTHTLMRDWGVVSRYKSFLDEWLTIMKQLVKKVPPPACRGAGRGRGAGVGAGEGAKRRQNKRTAKAKQRPQKPHAPP